MPLGIKCLMILILLSGQFRSEKRYEFIHEILAPASYFTTVQSSEGTIIFYAMMPESAIDRLIRFLDRLQEIGIISRYITYTQFFRTAQLIQPDSVQHHYLIENSALPRSSIEVNYLEFRKMPSINPVHLLLLYYLRENLNTIFNIDFHEFFHSVKDRIALDFGKFLKNRLKLDNTLKPIWGIIQSNIQEKGYTIAR